MSWLAFFGFRRIAHLDLLRAAFADLSEREEAARRRHEAVRPIQKQRQARLHAILGGRHA